MPETVPGQAAAVQKEEEKSAEEATKSKTESKMNT